MKRLALVALSSLGLAACGGTAKLGGGKEGAAQAFFAASSASKAGSDRAAQPLDVTGSVSWRCPEGGEASLSNFSLNIDTTGGALGASINQSFTIKYNNCGGAKSDAGVAVFNGSVTVTQAVVTTSTGATIEQTFKGRIDVQGAFNDFLEADVRQSVAANALGSGAGAVSMKLVGSIKTSSETFTYNENINVIAGGKLTVAAAASR
jgi:hypothetical protein